MEPNNIKSYINNINIYEILCIFRNSEDSYQMAIDLEQFHYDITCNKSFTSLNWILDIPLYTFKEIGPTYRNALYAILWIQEYIHDKTGAFYGESPDMRAKLFYCEQICADL